MPIIEENTEVSEWSKFVMKLSMNFILHPLEYSKTLMQMGYEPIPPRPGTTLLGSPALVLPNIFQYIRYIKRTDGIIGCYRGAFPKLMGNIVSSYGSEKVAEKFGLGYIPETDKSIERTEEQEFKQFTLQLKRDVVMHASSIIITQPFHVISLRMIAEFVGREGKYTSMFASIAEIYKEDGILGFFHGLVPRMIYDVSLVVLVSTSTYYVHQRWAKDQETLGYVTTFSQFVFASILYPFNVVSTCMAVNGPGLAIGRPPNMPIFKGWMDCWKYLKATNSLKRGSAIFFRYYNPSYGKTIFSEVPMPEIKYK